MAPMISHGWAPPLDLSTATGSTFWTPFRGNHLSASSFPGFVSSQVSTLLSSGVVSEASDIFRAYSPLLLNPLGVVFRPSDRARARACRHSEISSQADLDALNVAFAASGDKLLKTRLILDNSMSKLNEHSTPPFQYSSVHDLAASHPWMLDRHLRRGSFLSSRCCGGFPSTSCGGTFIISASSCSASALLPTTPAAGPPNSTGGLCTSRFQLQSLWMIGPQLAPTSQKPAQTVAPSRTFFHPAVFRERC